MLFNNHFFSFSHILIKRAELCAGSTPLADAEGTPQQVHTLGESVAGPRHGLFPCKRLCIWLWGDCLGLHATFWSSPVVFNYIMI